MRSYRMKVTPSRFLRCPHQRRRRKIIRVANAVAPREIPMITGIERLGPLCGGVQAPFVASKCVGELILTLEHERKGSHFPRRRSNPRIRHP